MCNLKKYEEFDDLPEDLKEKYKGSDTKKSKQSFVKLINLLNSNGHVLVGYYVNYKTKTLIDYNCKHGIREVTYNSYKDHPKCLLCSQEEMSKTTKQRFQNMDYEQLNDFKKKMSDVNKRQWDKRKNDEQFMSSFKHAIVESMNNMSEEEKQKRKDNISNTWANKTEEERTKFKLEHSRENSSRWKGGANSINEYIRSLICTKSWKKKVLEDNNYTCQITGAVGSSLNIHHIRSFNLLVEDANYSLKIEYKKEVNLYSENELNMLINYIESWHKDCSNYVVITKYLHRQFHLKYGNGNNTQEQWYEFIGSTSFEETKFS